MAGDTPVGRPYTFYETVIDDNNDPVVAATWDTVAALDPEGNSFAWVPENLGNGVYGFTFTPTFPGVWTLIVSTVVDGLEQRYQNSIEAEGYGPIITYPEPANGRSLRELRIMVARQLGDYRHVTASDGSLNTVTDVFNLVDNTDRFRGAEMVCTSGPLANVGKKVKVVSSSFETYTVTFIPDLPVAVSAGDEFDLFTFGRTPTTIQDYDGAINDAIRAADPANQPKVMVDLVDPFVRLDGGIAVPDTLTRIYRVAFRGEDGLYTDIPPGRYAGSEGWYIDRAQRMLVFGPGYAAWLDGKLLRVYGYTRALPLDTDEQRTDTDAEWIVDSAVASLLTRALDQAIFPIGQSRQNRADQLRSKMMRTPEPNTVSVT